MTSQSTIPLEHADFFYQAEPDGRPPVKFVVTDHRKQTTAAAKGIEEPYEDLPQSLGAQAGGTWLKTHPFPDSTPEGVFVALFLDQLDDRVRIRRGLAQIGKIEECAWARTMVEVFETLTAKDSVVKCPESAF